MYDVLPSFVLGFHGCNQDVADTVFAGQASLKPSENDYDWLGHGVYFWENSPERALAYAHSLVRHPKRTRGKVTRPAVVGAVIDLGRCLNLLDAESISFVKNGYEKLVATITRAGAAMPENKAATHSQDLLLRNLDCAVIEFAHGLREENGQSPFESVRAAFIEGKPLYANAGFHSHTHIQICVRDPRCIKGYFRVLPDPHKTAR